MFIVPVNVFPVSSGSGVFLDVSPLANLKKWELSSNYESVKLKKKSTRSKVGFIFKVRKCLSFVFS